MRARLLDLARPGIRFRRLGWPSGIALSVVALLILVALLAPLIAPYEPTP